MTVPKVPQIYPGVGVNIILKADQRSGELTPGKVSSILTKGNHPHGIKVRLSDGQVGRVQSLSTPSGSMVTTYPGATVRKSYGDGSGASLLPFERGRDKALNESFRGQEDYREDDTPLETRSIADYMKKSMPFKLSLPIQSSTPDNAENADQSRLEREFPRLDTALIAAILADHEDPDTVRGVLSSLS